ncbi:MAG: DUF3102 domain-containing protein [Duganella sp.]
MARTPGTTEPNGVVVNDADTPNLPAMADAANALAAHSLAIANQFGDGLPYERERTVNEARFYMGTAAEAMLETGKRLVQIKENEAHGEFERIVVERLGLSVRTAQRMMSTAVKFMSPKLSAKAPTLALLGKAKLFELMAEDDDDLAQLSDGGSVAGLRLDQIDRMTIRELRQALRESKENSAAQARLLSDKNDRIDQLDGAISKLKKHVQAMAPADVATEMRTEVTSEAAVAEVGIRRLRAGFAALADHTGEHGASHGDLMAGLLCQLELAIRELRSEFGIKATPDGNAVPEWLRDEPVTAGD